MRDWSNGFQNKYCFKLTNAAGRIFIGALCVGPQLAVLVAAGVGVLGAQETRVALLVALDPEVAAERLFRFGEAAARFCQQNLSKMQNGVLRIFGPFSENSCLPF